MRGETKNLELMRGLMVTEKWVRVQNYHKNILEDFLELLAASGCTSLEEMNRGLIYKNVGNKWKDYV